jgi:hypothetical protein
VAKVRKKTTGASVANETSAGRLLKLVDGVIAAAKTAKRNNKSLNGDNPYATKVADLRAEATNAYTSLATGSVGDTTALAELIEKTFSATTEPKERAQVGRELQFALKTTWAKLPANQSHLEDGSIFPLSALTKTGRGYMVAVGRQMNGSYASEWYDACAVMMRRLLEAAIIEAFEAKKIDSRIKDSNGDFFQLTALITTALAETAWNLSRNVKKELPRLRDLGHKSAHGRHYLAKKMYIDELKTPFRDAMEAFLHEANLT